MSAALCRSRAGNAEAMRNTRYLRFAALGDSTTCGIGDPVPTGWRGWARLLADALGYVVRDVLLQRRRFRRHVGRRPRAPARAALAHRPDLASLIVGVNDTMRSTWDPARLRTDLLECAAALHGQGALLLTARFHDHGAVFGLPGVLRRPLFARIEVVNRVYDEIHARYGGVRVDLGQRPEIGSRDFWSIDRLHPSEIGHRALARAYGELLLDEGLAFELPGLAASGGYEPSLAARPGLDGGAGCAVVRPACPRPRAVGGAAGVDRGPQGRAARRPSEGASEACPRLAAMTEAPAPRRPPGRRAPPDHDHPQLARPRRRARCWSSSAAPACCARRRPPRGCRAGARAPAWAGSRPSTPCSPPPPTPAPTASRSRAGSAAAPTRSPA